MVQNDIHRLHVFLFGEGKTKEAGWFLASLLAFVKGCGRKLFFACSGNGNGTTWNNRGGNGNYWSASFNSARNARNLNFNSGGVNPQNNNNRYNGFAVRSVQHTILTILFLMIYGADTSAAITRSVSGILRCETSQVETLLRQGLGEESETEHGRLVRRSVLQTLQASSVEVLHHRLSQEERNLRCHVSGQNRTSSVLQLYSFALREDIHSGHVQLHQESWHTLWHTPYRIVLSERVEKLATSLLRDALRHQGLLYAHRAPETLGDCRWHSKENGFGKDLGRYSGLGLHGMADGSNRATRPERELHHLWRSFRLGRTRPCQEYASLDGRAWFANRQPDESAVLECLSERVRPVHEARLEMPLLWSLRGRCSRSLSRQRVAIVACAEDKAIPESGVRIGAAHGQAGDNGSASRSGVLGCLHQALQDVYLESCLAENGKEDFGVRLLEALESASLREQLSWHLPAHSLVQAIEKAVDDKGDPENRHIRQRHDKVSRQKTFL